MTEENNKKAETEQYLLDKRKELMFSIAKQGYNAAQIGKMFGLSRTRAHAIIQHMPANYQSPWIKR